MIIQDSGGARQEAGVGRLGKENGVSGTLEHAAADANGFTCAGRQWEDADGRADRAI